jgi:hypothetical protein
MSLEHGIPKSLLLRWAYGQIQQHPGFSDAVYDEDLEAVFFTVPAKLGVQRRYKLTIERGLPVVEQVEGPPETRV